MTSNMKPWEFLIKNFEDLGPFADLLEEHGHPGVPVVRYLIKTKRFPDKRDTNNGARWVWYVTESVNFNNLVQRFWLPKQAYSNETTAFFSSPTEAIWAIVNYEIYKQQIKWYEN